MDQFTVSDLYLMNARPMAYDGPAREIHYFVYGSLMHPDDMGHRCPGARFLAPAVLYGYRLDFFGRNALWDSGKESLVPDPAGAVWGTVYELSGRDKDRLDLWFDARLDGTGEHFHVPGYALGTNQELYPVFFYRKSTQATPVVPSTEHRNFLCEAARLRGLPDAYIATLENRTSRPAAYPVPKRSLFNPDELLHDCGCGTNP